MARYGLKSIEEFRQTGLGEFGQERFERLCDAIDEFDLGIELLGYGFGPDNRPHIFEG